MTASPTRLNLAMLRALVLAAARAQAAGTGAIYRVRLLDTSPTTPAQRESEVHFSLPRGWRAAVPWVTRGGGTATTSAASPADLSENLLAFSRDRPEVLTAGGFRLSAATSTAPNLSRSPRRSPASACAFRTTGAWPRASNRIPPPPQPRSPGG